MGNVTEVVIEFIADIDMTDKSYTTPVNSTKDKLLWLKSLTVKGNNHYIKALNNPLFNMYGTDITISDLTIKDSTITKETGNKLGFGAFFEEAQLCSLAMTNCHAKNVALKGGNTRAAALVGYMVGEANIKNCSVIESTVEAKGSVGGIIGHAEDYDEEQKIGQTIEGCTVRNSTFKAVEEGWRVGSIVGTTNGTTTVKTCTMSGNTLTQETPKQVSETNPEHEVYGRVCDPGKLVIDNAAAITEAK